MLAQNWCENFKTKRDVLLGGRPCVVMRHIHNLRNVCLNNAFGGLSNDFNLSKTRKTHAKNSVKCSVSMSCTVALLKCCVTKLIEL